MRTTAIAVGTMTLLLGTSACQKQRVAVAEPSMLVIEGQLDGADQESVKLERAGTYVGFTFEEIATTITTDGRFRFETRLAAPELLYLSVEGQEGKTPLFVGNERVVVLLDPDGETPSEVVGSQFDTAFRAFRSAHQEAQQAVTDAEERLEELEATGTDEQIAVAREARDDAERARRTLALDWLVRYGDSTLGAYIGVRHLASQMDLDELDPMLAALSPNLAGTPYYDQLVQRAETLRGVAVGLPAPPVSGPTPEGSEVSLAELEGTVVLIDFWASWCAPCRQEHPELIALYDEHRSSGFEILGVALEFARDPWLEAIETDELPWRNICDVTGFDSPPAKTFGIRALPANVLVDRNGTIVAKNLHGEDLREEIERLL